MYANITQIMCTDLAILNSHNQTDTINFKKKKNYLKTYLTETTRQVH